MPFNTPTHTKKPRTPWLAALLPLLGALMLVLGFGLAVASAAPFVQQAGVSGATAVWEAPLNLSRSGGASAPRLVVDANGRTHVIWREDAVPSFFYASEVDGAWREPVAVRLPFTTTDQVGNEILLDPFLLADDQGRMHAFWQNEDANLLYSSAPVDEIATFSSWGSPQRLAETAVDFAVAQAGGGLYLTYVRNAETGEAPAGIYLRQLAGGAQAWSDPSLVFQSAYFRSIDATEANVGVAASLSEIAATAPITETAPVTATETLTATAGVATSADSALAAPANVLLVWDNALQEQVYAMQSNDSGATWTEAAIVDARAADDAEEDAGPAHIVSFARGDELHMTWVAGHGNGCVQYHQWSGDGGRTWSLPRMIAAEGLDCPTSNAFVAGEEGLILLLSQIGGVNYLRAWNGSDWSVPERQDEMSSFQDPVTYRRIDLGCQQTAVAGDHLVVAGCRQHRVSDTWLLERPLGDEADWFPTPEEQVWRSPVGLYSAEEVALGAPEMALGPDGLMHAFWTAHGRIGGLENATYIYYTRWDGDAWLEAIPLLLLDGPADQLSAAVDARDIIHLLWRDRRTSNWLYRRVASEDALFPSEWSVVTQLQTPHRLVDNAHMTLDTDGTVRVVYAVPLNEERGIYTVTAVNGGSSWSEPVRVADADAAGWDMVGRPQLAQAANGDWHAIWTRFGLQPDITPTHLYHARSTDGGRTWSEPEALAEGQTDWSQIAASGDGVVTAWQLIDGDQAQIWSRQSLDGAGWDAAQTVLKQATVPATAVLAGSGRERLHLVQTAVDTVGGLALQERSWFDDAWQQAEDNDLNTDLAGSAIASMSGALSADNRLLLLYVTQTAPRGDEPTLSSVLFAERISD